MAILSLLLLEMIGRLYVPATLSKEGEPQIPSGQETGRAPEQVWTLWRREEALPLSEIESCISVIQHVAWSLS